MNSEKIVELFKDGAIWENGEFFHTSFRKGVRKLPFKNISLHSAKKKLGSELKSDGNKLFINKGV